MQYNIIKLMNMEKAEIKNIYEKHVLKDTETFCVDDHNQFEAEIWTLKEKHDLKDSPFC